MAGLRKEPSKERRNWDTLTLEYLAFEGTLEEFAERKKIPLSTIRKQSAKLNWGNRKSENGTRVERTAEDLLIEDAATKLAEQNKRDCEAAEAVRNKALEFLPLCEKAADVKAVAGALKDAQAIVRLALGASTGNSNVSVSGDFEAWVNARLKEIDG